MNTQNKQIAPVWRLLEPGETILGGDEIYSAGERKWISIDRTWINESTYLFTVPLRRRIEPDPVKAELLAALDCFTRAAEWFKNNQDSPMSTLIHFLMAEEQSREVIARAKSTA